MSVKGRPDSNFRDFIARECVDIDLGVHSITDTVSVPELSNILSKLDSVSEGIKEKIRKNLSLAFPHYLNSVNIAIGLHSDAGRLHEDINEKLSLISNCNPSSDAAGEKIPPSGQLSAQNFEEGNEILLAVDYLRDVESKLQCRNQAISILHDICMIQERTAIIHKHAKDGDFVSSASLWLEMNSTANEDTRESNENFQKTPDSNILLRLLEEQSMDSLELISRTMQDSLKSIITVDEEGSFISITSGNSILGNVFSAMAILGTLETDMEKLSLKMHSCLILPIVQNLRSKISITESNQVVTLKIIQQTTQTSSSVDQSAMASLYTKLTKSLQFIKAHVCQGDTALFSLIGKHVWKKLPEDIITHCLAKAIPERAESLSEFEAITKLSSEFEEALSLEGFLSMDASPAVPARLAQYCADVEVHLATKKRLRVVESARKLLVDMNFDSIMVGGEAEKRPFWFRESDDIEDMFFSSFSDETEKDDKSFFSLEPFQVSKSTKLLIQLIHRTLQEASHSSPSISFALYSAVRDSLLLFRAIVPFLHRRSVEDVPALSFLFQNDCLYISHHLLTLGFIYRVSLPSPLSSSAMFVDLVPFFRGMAEEACNNQLKKQHAQLMEELDTGDGFKFTDDSDRYRMADKALKQVSHHLSRLCVVLTPILQQKQLLSCTAHLVNSVLYRIAEDVLALEDISVDETPHLQKLVFGFLHQVPSLLQSPEAGGGSAELRITEEDLRGLLPGFKKLQKLAECLDMPLADMTASWRNGELLLYGFSAKEVQGLVMAIFSDSPLRRESLEIISSSGTA